MLYLELFDLIRTLQAKDETKEEQLKELQEQLDQARDEIKSLKSKVEELKESLEFTQKQQGEANDKIERCEYDQDRQEEELIRQKIYSRRWNLIFHGIPESDLIKHAMVSKLKMDQKKGDYVLWYPPPREEKEIKQQQQARADYRKVYMPR